MILHSYQAFRPIFAVGGAPTDVDAFPVFPGTAKLRTGGFSGSLSILVSGSPVAFTVGGGFPTNSGLVFPSFPITLTVNALAADASPGVHAYDWWISQRTPLAAQQYLTVTDYFPGSPSASASYSGSVVIEQASANVAQLLPGHSGGTFTTAELTLLLRHVHVYVRRRSDGAFQFAKLFRE